MSAPLLLVATLVLGQTAELAELPEPVSLYDGRSLDGWRKVGGGATYEATPEGIVGRVGPGANTFLRTDRTYRNFILTLDFQLRVPGNSGVQFRAHQKPAEDGNGRVYGYQCEIDPSDRAWSAGIYDEARRGWLADLKDNQAAREAFRADGWNRYVIFANGPFLKTYVNGVAAADLVDPADAEGFVALQVHSGQQGEIVWKNIMLYELPDTPWQPVSDKSDAAGLKFPTTLSSTAPDLALKLTWQPAEGKSTAEATLAPFAPSLGDDPTIEISGDFAAKTDPQVAAAAVVAEKRAVLTLTGLKTNKRTQKNWNEGGTLNLDVDATGEIVAVEWMDLPELRDPEAVLPESAFMVQP